MNDHETIAELIPLYALGGVDIDEAARIRVHLSGCAICRRELAVYEAVADMLPLALPEVSPAATLKERLFARLEPLPVETAVPLPAVSWRQTIQMAFSRAFTRPVWKPLALSLIVLLLVLNAWLWRQVEQGEAPGFLQHTLSGTAAAPEARGLLIISHDGYGTLVVTKLPDLAPGQEYQLWLIKNGERTSGGVFSVYADGYQSVKIDAPAPLDSYTAFQVTIEPGGGSSVPTGQRVLD